MIDAPIITEEVTDSDVITRARAHDQRMKRNLDWLNAHWDDLLPGSHGRYVAVAGQEAFVADHPEDNGAFSQYVKTKLGPRIYANRGRVASR
jgi:hypothetical protein